MNEFSDDIVPTRSDPMNEHLNDSGQPDYLTEIADLTQAVENGHTLVKDGNTIDLANLEIQIAELCRRMSLVPPDDADAVTITIQKLVGRLGALSDAIQVQANKNN